MNYIIFRKDGKKLKMWRKWRTLWNILFFKKKEYLNLNNYSAETQPNKRAIEIWEYEFWSVTDGQGNTFLPDTVGTRPDMQLFVT
jgi:hypothetical protein